MTEYVKLESTVSTTAKAADICRRCSADIAKGDIIRMVSPKVWYCSNCTLPAPEHRDYTQRKMLPDAERCTAVYPEDETVRCERAAGHYEDESLPYRTRCHGAVIPNPPYNRPRWKGWWPPEHFDRPPRPTGPPTHDGYIELGGCPAIHPETGAWCSSIDRDTTNHPGEPHVAYGMTPWDDFLPKPITWDDESCASTTAPH